MSSDIRPIDLPTAAGVEFGRGDVRHFSESDAVDVVGLQNPTRQLAERDNLLAEKLNEVVAEVNNKEQFVPIMVPRTTVAPGVEEVVTNFAIPAGFEARVVNATVGSSPVSSDLALKISFSTGFGNVTGTELVSTTSTFMSGVAFYNSGEFIISLRNNGATTLEIVASITLTVRPIGTTASLLVGSVIKGDKGYTGGRGVPGLKGDPGTGGAGTPGMTWSGPYVSTNSYSPPQVVSYTVGGLTQSYISLVTNPAAPGFPSQPPTNAVYWDLIASSGGSGAGLVWRGAWSNALTYAVNDAVSDTVGGITSSYVCYTAVNPASNAHPGADAPHWNILAAPGNGETPTYASADVSSLMAYSALPAGQPVREGIYGSYALNDQVAQLPPFTFQEFAVQNTSIESPHALVFFTGQIFVNLLAAGTLTFALPVSALSVGAPWFTNEVSCNVTSHGTVNPGLVNITAVNGAVGTYAIANETGLNQHIGISLFGIKTIV